MCSPTRMCVNSKHIMLTVRIMARVASYGIQYARQLVQRNINLVYMAMARRVREPLEYFVTRQLLPSIYRKEMTTFRGLEILESVSSMPSQVFEE